MIKERTGSDDLGFAILECTVGITLMSSRNNSVKEAKIRQQT